MPRITITLSEFERDTLIQLSLIELRLPGEQAHFLLRNALKRRRLFLSRAVDAGMERDRQSQNQTLPQTLPPGTIKAVYDATEARAADAGAGR